MAASTKSAATVRASLVSSSAIAVYDFYIEKTKYLIEQSNGNWLCSESIGSKEIQKTHYEDLLSRLEETKNYIQTEKFNNPSNLISFITSIEASERELEKFNCEFVY